MESKSKQPGRGKGWNEDDSSAGIVNPRARQRAACVAVLDGSHGAEERLAELKELLHTAGVAVAGELIQHRSSADPNTYLGSGKLELLKEKIEECDANIIACDDELSPRQERNLEQELGVPVVDRTEVILDIFASHASSADGKLQVELAQLEYNMARMRGLWTHLERLGGGIGTRGPGETQIETDRRLARNRIKSLKTRLKKQRSRRELARTARERAVLPTAALAGYTNAGKTTLLNALTGADSAVAERLFHTLDPTTRSFDINGRKYLMTDTVGFIRKLPHQLIEAFAATLEETSGADLIVHVVDASLPQEEMDERIEVVEQVLDEIGVGDTPRLLVLNKADLVEKSVQRGLIRQRPESVAVSASEGKGIEQLNRRVAEELSAAWERVELLIPFGSGRTLNEIHEIAGDLEREDTPEGVRVVASMPTVAAQKFGRFSVDGAKGE